MRVDERAARGRQVVRVDRPPHGGGIEAPYGPGVLEHRAEGVPDDWRGELVEVEEMTSRVVDADGAVGGVGQHVGNDNGSTLANPAAVAQLGRELGRGPLEVLGAERAERRLRGERGQVGPGRGWSFTPRRMRVLRPVSGSRRHRSCVVSQEPGACRSGTVASSERSS